MARHRTRNQVRWHTVIALRSIGVRPVPSLKEQFGFRLKSIRQSRKLTQEQFAELVGISVDFLSLIERGVNAPSFDRIEQIASRLDLSVSSLFTFPPSKEKKHEKGKSA